MKKLASLRKGSKQRLDDDEDDGSFSGSAIMPGGDISFWQEWHSPSDTLEFMTAKAGGQAGMASGFNSLVWSSMDLFIRVDNAENFHGTWKE